MSAQFKKNAVSFDTYEWDFGTVASDKGAVCHTFTLKNNTKKDVRIGKQIPSCECITARYADEVIRRKEGKAGKGAKK